MATLVLFLLHLSAIALRYWVLAEASCLMALASVGPYPPLYYVIPCPTVGVLSIPKTSLGQGL